MQVRDSAESLAPGGAGRLDVLVGPGRRVPPDRRARRLAPVHDVRVAAGARRARRRAAALHSVRGAPLRVERVTFHLHEGDARDGADAPLADGADDRAPPASHRRRPTLRSPRPPRLTRPSRARDPRATVRRRFLGGGSDATRGARVPRSRPAGARHARHQSASRQGRLGADAAARAPRPRRRHTRWAVPRPAAQAHRADAAGAAAPPRGGGRHASRQDAHARGVHRLRAERLPRRPGGEVLPSLAARRARNASRLERQSPPRTAGAARPRLVEAHRHRRRLARDMALAGSADAPLRRVSLGLGRRAQRHRAREREHRGRQELSTSSSSRQCTRRSRPSRRRCAGAASCSSRTT